MNSLSEMRHSTTSDSVDHSMSSDKYAISPLDRFSPSNSLYLIFLDELIKVVPVSVRVFDSFMLRLPVLVALFSFYEIVSEFKGISLVPNLSFSFISPALTMYMHLVSVKILSPLL